MATTKRRLNNRNRPLVILYMMKISGQKKLFLPVVKVKVRKSPTRAGT